MPEARDRLVRPVDVAVVFAQRRQGVLGILQDEPESASNPLGSPLGRAAAATPRVQTRVAGRGGGLGTPRSGVVRGRRNAFGSATVTRGPIGRENTPAGSAARRGRTVLPSWYPRTPLRDITAVVRAIERRRAHLGEVEGLQMESPMSHSQRGNDSFVPLSGAPPEHNISMMTPTPTLSVKACPPSIGKVPKILLDITNQAGAELESLTPQKKLLNSIDKVEKVVMEELNKLKRTPTAKKAEREKRVRTLMSMR
ncbi:protein POLYCHOME [Citrus sinensis]|uniref:Protein POLYCHOME n=1 Tax=Citrus clementina TaxID=85681 RepID=V4RKR5_CITCL|nr:protein POLYCHOME [Citrus x clementina]XP_015389410.2 protein POLYCHOME [Citrus sinensis]ESR34733.1 hypothetical protein CICLE_v10005700mg [Citrus x clementina]KAH9648051.1 protein POLYCHOME [Citrus sinensis]